MLTKRTTLILGAGASMDFGFPSGWELRLEVLRMLAPGSTPGIEALEQLGYTRSDRAEFAEALRHSGASSVDAFLGTRADLVGIGKAAIAAALIAFESPDKIHPLTGGQSWLDLLLARMAGSLEEWRRNDLAIVTFNYDRVMEFALHSALRHAFNLSPEKAGAILSKVVRIVHVHGQLGGYPDVRQYEGLPTGPDRRFTTEVTSESVRSAASGIRILHEGAAADEPFTKARELIAWAEEVLVFGFGFHRESCERLNLRQSLDGKTTLASVFGVEDQELSNAKTRAGASLNTAQSTDTLPLVMRRSALLGNLG